MRLFAVIGTLVCITACTTTLPPSIPPQPGHLSRSEVLNRIASHPAGVSFFWDDKRSADDENLITFTKDGRVALTQYGVVVTHHSGTWQVDAAGAIHVSVPRKTWWPVTYLYTDKRGAFLLPS